MKLAILPNWCKWVSLALLVTAFFIDFTNFKEDVVSGRNSIYHGNQQTNSAQTSSNTTDSMSLFDFITMVSIIVYILSKDKKDDEFINSIRAQALLAALLVTSVTVMIVYAFNGQLDVSYLILIQLLSYIIIFKYIKYRAGIDNDYLPSTE